jgi:transposase
MEPHGSVLDHQDRLSGTVVKSQNSDDRCDPPEYAPDGLEPRSQKGGRGRLIGRTKGGLNSKLHVPADAKNRPIHMFHSAGQTSDYIGARALLSQVRQAGAVLADRDYDADWLRNALIELRISPCIPSKIGCKVQIRSDAALYRLRHKIENMFPQLKDWRRVATRYDRCSVLFLSA